MADKLEDRIMECLYEGLTYKEIQNKCDGVSKGFIKKVIKKNNPELFDIISDTKKLQEYRYGNWKKHNSGI